MNNKPKNLYEVMNKLQDEYIDVHRSFFKHGGFSCVADKYLNHKHTRVYENFEGVRVFSEPECGYELIQRVKYVGGKK